MKIKPLRFSFKYGFVFVLFFKLRDRPQHSIIAVSYTHLDVYKRQVHIMGKLNACFMSFPVNKPVFNHKSTFQNWIMKFPFIKLICSQLIICTEGTWRSPSLDYFVTFMSDYFFFWGLQGFNCDRIQIKKLICLYITDVNITPVSYTHL